MQMLGMVYYVLIYIQEYLKVGSSSAVMLLCPLTEDKLRQLTPVFVV